jgi:hypothetical protein
MAKGLITLAVSISGKFAGASIALSSRTSNCEQYVSFSGKCTDFKFT